MHRCLLAGLKLDIIAKIIGIDFIRLNQWMKAYPELQDIEVKALSADAGVVKSLHDLATGSWAEDGKQRKPDVIACLFWLKARANWSDQPPPKSAPLTPKDMSLDELRNLATMILVQTPATGRWPFRTGRTSLNSERRSGTPHS